MPVPQLPCLVMSGTMHTLTVPVQCSHVAKNDIDCFACTSFLRTLKVLAAHFKIYGMWLVQASIDTRVCAMLAPILCKN